MDPRACTGPFRCVGPLHVAIRLWTWIHVPVPALFGVFALCTLVYATGRVNTYLYWPFSMCSPGSRGCTPLDEDQRACTGPFQSLILVHVGVRFWTWIHVPIPALCGVFACARGCTPLDVDPRACTGPFGSVRLVHMGVGLWTWINVPVSALFDVYALCTWVYASGL